MSNEWPDFKRNADQRQQQWEQRQLDNEKQQKNWEANQESISRRNEMIADGILGKTNIIDPESGSKTKIDNTSNHYWVNTQGQYVGTDKSYEDPNKNAWMNNETWREFKIDDYK